MKRRDFLAMACALPALADAPPVKLGIDLFSLRSAKWTPFQFLDYCSRQGAMVVHFSEVRFLGGLAPDHLRAVREHAARLGIEIEIGMLSICPTAKRFKPEDGPAEEQLSRMIDAAQIVGSRIVRCVLGGMEDRATAPMGQHMANTVAVLKKVRSRAIDKNIKIAIENHAGDMQAREVRELIEMAGRDFVGSCLDAGNPLWTLEDPHVTLETLYPYVLTSHVRDSMVWRTPEGAAVNWVRMGEGDVDIEGWVRRYVQLCPGRALSLESIVYGPRMFPYRDPKFWDDYHDVEAWSFERFVEIAERGKPQPPLPGRADPDAERADLEASLRQTRAWLGLPQPA